MRLGDEEHPHLLLLPSLVIFSPPSRLPVFVMGWIDTKWELGTDDNIFESWGQALFSQLFCGSVIQVIPVFSVGSVVLGIKRAGASTA